MPEAAHIGEDGGQVARYVLRLGDSALVLGHRLSEWVGHAPVLEEELALANLGLDLIGQARALLGHAAALQGTGTEDTLAYLRPPEDFVNLLLVEQPNGDFAVTMARHVFYSVYAEELWRRLANSRDRVLAGIAMKAEKETAYHVRHAAEWMIRLGDGTDESRARMQAAVDVLWPFTGEMFEADALDLAMCEAGIGADPRAIKSQWDETIGAFLDEATLTRPRDGWMQSGGRRGRHTEHLGHMLATMQSLVRAHPGATW